MEKVANVTELGQINVTEMLVLEKFPPLSIPPSPAEFPLIKSSPPAPSPPPMIYLSVNYHLAKFPPGKLSPDEFLPGQIP